MTARRRIADEHTGTVVEVSLAAAVQEFLRWCKTVRNAAPSTIANHRMVLDILLTVTGEGLYAHQLSPTHIAMALQRASTGETKAETIQRQIRNPNAKPRTPRRGRTLNKDKSTYNTFVRFLRIHEYLSPFVDPVAGLRYSPNKVPVRQSINYVVPHDKWEGLLKLAGDRHPRDRIIVAMGLYGGRRWSDMANMLIRDINLDDQTFTFRNTKGGGREVTLPILWPEFAAEIRRWLSWYAASQRMNWDEDWYFIPRRLQTREAGRDGKEAAAFGSWPIDPTQPTPRKMALRDVKFALEVIGAPMEGTGPHLLRHSCADWLLTDQEWDIYDVQKYLDHESVTTTQGYVEHGRTVERLRGRYGDPTKSRDTPPARLAQVIQFKRELSYLGDEDEESA
jgi:integrase